MGRLPRVVAAVGVVALVAALGLSRCTATDHDGRDAAVMATGLEVPWGLVFLPDGDVLVGERMTGDLWRVPEGGGERSLAGTVPDVEPVGEGGLLGLALDPLFIHSGRSYVYAYVTTPTDNRIVRFRLDPDGEGLYDFEVMLDGIGSAGVHNGGALAFGPDGMLYAGVGDAGDPGSAQDPASLNGKILRMDPLGNPPRDNPDPASLVWSMGHRNVQGLAWDDEGRLYATEFGQNEFDELNRIEPGGNYGWPEVEGEGGGDEYVDPLVTWTPDEASPSGVAFAQSGLWVAALRGQRLWMIGPGDLAGEGRPSAVLWDQFGRLRNVQVAPDGCLWITTSNRDGRGEFDGDDDRVLRVNPTRAEMAESCELNGNRPDE